MSTRTLILSQFDIQMEYYSLVYIHIKSVLVLVQIQCRGYLEGVTYQEKKRNLVVES